MLRSLKQAMYSPDNVGHFGLAYEHYTHFTFADPPLSRSARPSLVKRARWPQQYEPEQPWDDIGLQCLATERQR